MSGTSDGTAPPVLVVDVGTTSSAAAVVTGDTTVLVPEPMTGAATWPSAVFWDGQQMLVGTLAERRKRSDPEAFAAGFKRGLADDTSVLLGPRRFRPVEQVVAVLSTLRAEAERLHGAPIHRAVLTVPASYGGLGAGGDWTEERGDEERSRLSGPGTRACGDLSQSASQHSDVRRTRMVAAAEAAGFQTIELLPEPVAAAFAPIAGAPFRPGDLVLVYDLGGGTFDTALVRIGVRWHEVLGHAALDDCGGHDIDALLARRISTDGQQWLAPLTSAAGSSTPATLRLDMAVTDFAQRVKHQLSDAAVVEDFLMPNTPAYRMSQEDLSTLAAPLLSRTATCCTDLLARLGVPVHDVTAALLVGGGSRMPAVADLLQRGLGLPLRRVVDPELATVRGAARWVPVSGQRRVSARTSPEPTVPLSWNIPAGGGRLLRWLVSPGQAYLAGVPLARVRLSSGAVWDLTASSPGTLDRLLVPPDTDVTAGDWLALARP
ncbi:Hsp70 family protein [Micromonospora sp. CPCC 206061]|uniref:Hsp70 family protein n=1 Tax=Micromonospora sp. CPCC 206061 TaxID=3122410 RepID=UPI002FF2954C